MKSKLAVVMSISSWPVCCPRVTHFTNTSGKVTATSDVENDPACIHAADEFSKQTKICMRRCAECGAVGLWMEMRDVAADGDMRGEGTRAL